MKHPEQDLQIAVVDWLKIAAPDLLFFSVPNAINMRGGKKAGAFNKAMGARAGVADLCFVLFGNYSFPQGRAHFIELKAPKGRQSDNQKAFQAACKAVGAPYAICMSIDEVKTTLRGWGIKLRVAE